MSTPRASAREDLRRNCCSACSRVKKCVVRRSIGSKGRHFTGAGSASSLARIGAWFFPESDEVIGEIGAAGCCSEPGEKNGNKTAGEAIPNPGKGKLQLQRPGKPREKKAATVT